MTITAYKHDASDARKSNQFTITASLMLQYLQTLWTYDSSDAQKSNHVKLDANYFQLHVDSKSIHFIKHLMNQSSTAAPLYTIC